MNLLNIANELNYWFSEIYSRIAEASHVPNGIHEHTTSLCSSCYLHLRKKYYI